MSLFVGILLLVFRREHRHQRQIEHERLVRRDRAIAGAMFLHDLMYGAAIGRQAAA